MSGIQKQILAVVLVPVFMSLLSVSIINVVLPSIQSSLDTSTSALQWVLSGYTLAFGVVLVAAGRAGDIYGRGRLFVLGVGLFGLGSLLAGFAPNALTLNAARIVMGLGSGLLNPQTVGFIQQYFRGAARGRAFGMFGSIVGVSVAIGPVLGGALVGILGLDWGWRAAFLINVPVALIALLAARLWLPASAWRPLEADGSASSAPEASPGSEGAVRSASAGPSGPRRRPDLDPVGGILLGLATLSALLPFLEHGAGAWIWSLLVLAVGLVVAWIVWEKRYKARGGAPMVDLALFRTSSFAHGSLLIAFYFTGVPAVWVVVAVFLQSGMGMSALHAGLFSLPAAVASAISAAVAGRYVTRIGRPLVVWGVAIALFSLVTSIGVVWLNATTGLSVGWLLLTLLFIGIAQGMVISPNQTLTLVEVPLHYAGSAGGILQTGQRIGTAIGLAVVTAVFYGAQGIGGWDFAFGVAFAAIGAAVLATGIVAVHDTGWGRRGKRRRSTV